MTCRNARESRRGPNYSIWFVTVGVGLTVSIFAHEDARADAVACKMNLVAQFDDAYQNGIAPVLHGIANGHPVSVRLNLAAEGDGGIGERSADVLGRSQQSAVEGVIGRQRLDKVLLIRELELDHITFKNVEIFVVPNLKINYDNPENPIIVLTHRIFKDLDLELDPLNDRVRIWKHKNCDKVPVPWYTNNVAVIESEFRFGKYQMSVNGTLGGRDVGISFSSDQFYSTITQRFAKKILPDDQVNVDNISVFPQLNISDAIKMPSVKLKVVAVKKLIGDYGNDHFGGFENNFEEDHASLIIGAREMSLLHMMVVESEHSIVMSSIADDIAAAQEQARKAGLPVPDFSARLDRINAVRNGSIAANQSEGARQAPGN